jgi:hypothetical protein
MSQNRSTAVMQRRRVAPDSLDYFPTPPFATRALCEFLGEQLGGAAVLGRMTAWDPGCGELHMVRPLRESFAEARASDVHRYCDGHELIDFLIPSTWLRTGPGPEEASVDFVITNPPFRLAEAFIETGLKVAREGVAMLVRSAFLEAQGRYDTLWSRNPPSHVLQFCERVVMLEGRLIRAGAADPFNDGKRASSATSYCWLVWLKDHAGTQLRWIPACLARLERPGDYPDYGVTAVTAAPLFGDADGHDFAREDRPHPPPQGQMVPPSGGEG